jgi:hypothetical protein
MALPAKTTKSPHQKLMPSPTTKTPTTQVERTRFAVKKAQKTSIRWHSLIGFVDAISDQCRTIIFHPEGEHYGPLNRLIK